MKFNLIILLIYLLSATAYPQLNLRDIDDYYQKLYSYNQFNGCVLIAKDGSIKLNYCYGKYNLRNNKDFSSRTKFYLGNISNQFISFATLLLIKEHKISETDFVKEFLPDFPYNDIQIVHLLTCTSGITDYIKWRGYVWESKKTIKPNDVLFVLKKYSIRTLYKAGDDYNYSNTNFVILRLLIEKITGKEIGIFLKEKIFAPYELLDTQYTTSFSETEYPSTGYVFSVHSNTYVCYQTPQNIYDLDLERSIGTIVTSLINLNNWLEISSKIELPRYENYYLNPNIQFEQIFPIRSKKNIKTYFWSSTNLGNKIRIFWDIEHSFSFIEANNITTSYSKKDSSFLEVSNQLFYDNANSFFPAISIMEKIKMHPNDYIELINLSKKSGFLLESSEIFDFCRKFSQKNNTELSIKILNRYFQNEYSEEYYSALAELYVALGDTIQALTYLDKILVKDSTSYKAKILKNKISPDFSWNSYYTKRQVVEDLKYLHAAYKKYHPGLFDYLMKDTLDSIFYSKIKTISDSINYYDFFKILSAIFPEIKDSHTDFGGSPRHTSEFLEEHLFLPLDVMLIKGNLYVTKDCSTLGEIGAGARILAINGRDISDIIKKIKEILPSDGNNLTNKSQSFKSFFRGLYIGAIEAPDKYTIDFIPYNEKQLKKIEVMALSNDTINSIKSQRYEEEAADERLLSYKQINSLTGLLKIKSFNIYLLKNKGENFNHFLDSSFAQIKSDSIKHLIIDLRNNEGGRTPYGMLLFSYLTDKPFAYIDSTIVNRFWDCHYSDNFLRIPRTEYDKRSYIQFSDGKYVVSTYPLQYCNIIPKNNFKGNVYILINGGSSSCTGLFCSIARKNNRAIFIGEESGSAYGGFSADPFVLLLPNTLFKVSISGMKFKIATNGDLARGVIPDFEILPSIDDILTHRDVELEFTLNLISGKEDD